MAWSCIRVRRTVLRYVRRTAERASVNRHAMATGPRNRRVCEAIVIDMARCAARRPPPLGRPHIEAVDGAAGAHSGAGGTKLMLGCSILREGAAGAKTIPDTVFAVAHQVPTMQMQSHRAAANKQSCSRPGDACQEACAVSVERRCAHLMYARSRAISSALSQ